jgi:hypothetical protein
MKLLTYTVAAVAMWHVLWTKAIELTYEILGIRPLLIDKLSNYCIQKDGVLLSRVDSYSSALPVIVDPFIAFKIGFSPEQCMILF